jgi:hypothetical protein
MAGLLLLLVEQVAWPWGCRPAVGRVLGARSQLALCPALRLGREAAGGVLVWLVGVPGGTAAGRGGPRGWLAAWALQSTLLLCLGLGPRLLMRAPLLAVAVAFAAAAAAAVSRAGGALRQGRRLHHPAQAAAAAAAAGAPVALLAPPQSLHVLHAAVDRQVRAIAAGVAGAAGRGSPGGAMAVQLRGNAIGSDRAHARWPFVQARACRRSSNSSLNCSDLPWR